MAYKEFISEFLNKTIYSGNKLIVLISSLVLLYLVYKIASILTKRALLRNAKTAKQKANVTVFIHVIKYLFIVFGFLAVIFISTGSLTGLGISAGLFTAALGWALQRPITGIAAWLMVLIRKPFQIGDRIAIGDTRGDVSDISLTHIYLGEIGGTVASEESSGRIILIPNSILFEQKVINYTMQDEFILDEAVTLITYESNLEKAKKICLDAANKYFDKSLKKKKEKPFVRVFQQDSGIHVKVRYKVRTSKRIEVLSNIHNEIINNIAKTKDVNIAYPHMHLIKKDKIVKW
jgi:small-conductance mechanosensitive channel